VIGRGETPLFEALGDGTLHALKAAQELL